MHDFSSLDWIPPPPPPSLTQNYQIMLYTDNRETPCVVTVEFPNCKNLRYHLRSMCGMNVDARLGIVFFQEESSQQLLVCVTFWFQQHSQQEQWRADPKWLLGSKRNHCEQRRRISCKFHKFCGEMLLSLFCLFLPVWRLCSRWSWNRACDPWITGPRALQDDSSHNISSNKDVNASLL